MRAWFIAAALLATACLLPASAAPEPPRCDGETQPGPVQASFTDDCRLRVDVDLMDCVHGGSWRTYGAGPAEARVYTCDGNPPS